MLVNTNPRQPLLVTASTTAEITRADTAVYSATDKDGDSYIGAMDGSYIKDGETFYYNTENPSATKFTITIPVNTEGVYADESDSEDGTQISYIINYTAGDVGLTNPIINTPLFRVVLLQT